MNWVDLAVRVLIQHSLSVPIYLGTGRVTWLMGRRGSLMKERERTRPTCQAFPRLAWRGGPLVPRQRRGGGGFTANRMLPQRGGGPLAGQQQGDDRKRKKGSALTTRVPKSHAVWRVSSQQTKQKPTHGVQERENGTRGALCLFSR